MTRGWTLPALAVFVCMTAITEQAAALTCYTCNSSELVGTVGACSDPFLSSSVSTARGCLACGKVYTEVTVYGVSANSYIRTCELATPATTGCSQPFRGSQLSATLCYCATDKCNSAVLSVSSAASIFAANSLVALYIAR